MVDIRGQGSCMGHLDFRSGNGRGRGRHEVKQDHSPFAEESHKLLGRFVFAAIWARVAVVSWVKNRNPRAIFETRKTYVFTKIIWKGLRRLIRRALVPVPPVRRYLAEKHILQSSLMQAAAECIRLQSHVERLRLAQEAIVTERDALTVERIHPQAEVARQRSTLEAIAIERDALTVERTHLQAEIERQRIALSALAADREPLQ